MSDTENEGGQGEVAGTAVGTVTPPPVEENEENNTDDKE